MYGTQTTPIEVKMLEVFENDVEMYGTQTIITQAGDLAVFENDVEMYGTQTQKFSQY